MGPHTTATCLPIYTDDRYEDPEANSHSAPENWNHVYRSLKEGGGFFFIFFWFIGAVDKREFITLRIRTCHAPTLGSPARPVAQAREERGVLKLAKALFACACINLNSYVLKYIGVELN
jgi:hypothetical protein